MAIKKAWKKFQAFLFSGAGQAGQSRLAQRKTPLLVFSDFGKPTWRNWQTR
jgi:hypothetical protein